jgi:hypothetical protein
MEEGRWDEGRGVRTTRLRALASGYGRGQGGREGENETRGEKGEERK